MPTFEEVYADIVDGKLPLPKEVLKLPKEKIRKIVEPLFDYFHKNSSTRRSERKEVVHYSQFRVDQNDYTVLIINLSITGALIMVNKFAQKFYTTANAWLLIQPHDFVGMDAADFWVKAEFSRQSELRAGFVFFGIRFTELDLLEEQLLKELIDHLPEGSPSVL